MSHAADWRAGAVASARAIASGQASAIDVVGAAIARAERVGPSINAIVHPRFDEAMARAAEADAAAARGESWGPLHGVPVTHKESLSEPGSPLTLGSRYRLGRVAKRRAASLQRLVDAGAIVLGATNVPELAFWMETDNLVYGPTHNPYALDRTPGGSSGGEAAILAAGGSMLGLGTDTAGSIRNPAACCGIFGHKPTQGLVPVDGHHLHDEQPELDAGLATSHLCVGPMSRDARDLWPALAILSGRPERADEPPPRPARVLVWDDPAPRLATPVRADVRLAVWRAAQALKRRRAQLSTWSHPAMRDAFDIWHASITRGGGASLAERFTLGQGFDPRAELARYRAGAPRHTLAASTFALGERVRGISPARAAALIERAARLRGALFHALGPGGVLVLPTQPVPARAHGAALARPWDLGYTAVFNAIGLPVTAAPMGLDADGLPLGVQIVARAGEDAVAIGAALALQEDFGGWVEPRGL
jgi:fatty acid amide hydrolase 2